ncbi:hypothetical protein EIKCOROL_00913 [Eikenella corrodens ATCC 23834]|uniref:Uncharacterized protein n=1 Tax=Eikenella corrodens ATCC 23834 TaxID=546274 RepID=C0DU82_EIKCO|nr:hypothetical protein EIKCOROL_00913 [Eikenella corrodens ATCC 23834]
MYLTLRCLVCHYAAAFQLASRGSGFVIMRLRLPENWFSIFQVACVMV